MLNILLARVAGWSNSKVHSVAYSVPYRMALVSSKLIYSQVRYRKCSCEPPTKVFDIAQLSARTKIAVWGRVFL